MKEKTEKLNAVIYARYSSDSQREESIEGQLRECKEFAERNGITVFGSYIDRALTAKTDHRPEFQRMVKDSYKKLFDVVIVWKLDRFARNRYDSAHYKMTLKKNGVRVISAKEQISEGSEGIILEAVLEGYAEYYSVELSEKIGRGLTENALKGKINGGALPIGYTIGKDRRFEIDEAGASIVREVFTRYADGERMNDLAKDLTRRGVHSSRGNRIKIDVIHHMLKNRRYIGEYQFRDIVREDAFPAIVPKELFERVQEVLRKNAKAPARHKAEDDYILTTKLRCGKCGAFMVGESGTSRTGQVHHYYKCANVKKQKTCGKKPVKKVWIEEIVVKQAMVVVMDDGVIGKIADAILSLVSQENTKLPQLKAKIKDVEGGIQNMLNAIQQGVLTPSTKQRLTELEEAQAEIQTAILSEELQKPELTREHILYWITRFRDIDLSDLDSRKRLIDGFVNTVYLYDDKLTLTFNYKDGTKSISLNELANFDEFKEIDVFDGQGFCNTAVTVFDNTANIRYNMSDDKNSSDLTGSSPPTAP
ncbi:MAG: recombinase family protein [Clostridiales bacterium]|jgi:DNA invertase Pin-like site-specific DNA recombinase|nr:recombinase family protein [Clostridiales bacterium]